MEKGMVIWGIELGEPDITWSGSTSEYDLRPAIKWFFLEISRTPRSEAIFYPNNSVLITHPVKDDERNYYHRVSNRRVANNFISQSFLKALREHYYARHQSMKT